MASKQDRLCDTCQRLTKARSVRVDYAGFGTGGERDTYRIYMLIDKGSTQLNPYASPGSRHTLPLLKLLGAMKPRLSCPPEYEDKNAIVHKSWAELEHTALATRCHLCFLLYESVIYTYKDVTEKVPPADAIAILQFHIINNHDPFNLRVELIDGKELLLGREADLSRNTFVTEALNVSRPGGSFRLRANGAHAEDITEPFERSSRLAESGHTHLCVEPEDGQNTQRLPEHTVSRLRNWLQRCIAADYDRCWASSQLRSAALPTRLLRIDRTQADHADSFRVRLVETRALLDASTLCYATVSHCWGDVMPVRLLRKDYENWLRGVDFDTLPRTFRDAVVVATALDISYLWIDALCIVQDSEKDWLAEAPTMGNVFAGSHVTFAATASTDCEGGLLVQDRIRTGCAITFDCGDPMQGLLVIEPDSFDMHVEKSHWNSRAWVFQERFLSPRTIYFTGSEIWWTCRTTIGREFDDGSETFALLEPLKNFQGSELIDFLVFYTRKSLTYPTDKLVAFAGIAETLFFQNHRPASVYLAGLESDHFDEQILWTRVGTESFQLSDQSLRYTAPSWSWASQPGCVRWVNTKSLTYPSVSSSCHEDSQLLEADIEYRSKNPFGAVNSARVTISALVLEIIDLTSSILTVRGSDGTSHNLVLSLALWIQNTSIPETYQVPEDWKPTHAAAVSSGSVHSGPQGTPYENALCETLALLLLAKVKGQRGTYRRTDIWLTDQKDGEYPAWWLTGSSLRQDDYLVDGGEGKCDIDLILRG